MIQEIVVNAIMSDEDIQKCEGTYFDSSHYNHIVTTDTDVYINKNGQKQLLLRFRKNVIGNKLTNLAIEAYRNHAKTKTANRGAAAGIIDKKRLPRYVRDSQLYGISKYRTSYIDKNGKLSKLSVGNQASSNIAGYFDNTARNLDNTNIPCRLTSFSSKHQNLWQSSLPFILKCDELFQKLVPQFHQFPEAEKLEYTRCTLETLD